MHITRSIQLTCTLLLLGAASGGAQEAPFKHLTGKWFALEGYHVVDMFSSGSGVFQLTVYQEDTRDFLTGTLKSAHGNLSADIPDADLTNLKVSQLNGPDGQTRYQWNLGDQELTFVRALTEGITADDFVGSWMQEIRGGREVQYALWRFEEEGKGVVEEIGWDHAQRVYVQDPPTNFQWKWANGILTIRRAMGLTRWGIPRDYQVLETTGEHAVLFDDLLGHSLVFKPTTRTSLPSPPSGFRELD